MDDHDLLVSVERLKISNYHLKENLTLTLNELQNTRSQLKKMQKERDEAYKRLSAGSFSYYEPTYGDAI